MEQIREQASKEQMHGKNIPESKYEIPWPKRDFSQLRERERND